MIKNDVISTQRDNSREYRIYTNNPQNLMFWGFSLCLNFCEFS